MEKELRKQLRNMKSMEIKHFGKYSVTKLGKRYAFSSLEEDDYECSYIGTTGEKQALEWIVEQ